MLSAAQFQCSEIIFNSTLTASVTITFPTSFIKSYAISNQCTGSSAFIITMQTTAGGVFICPPPNEIVDIISDGTSLRFKNLGRIGTYWDYAGSSVPNWVSGCATPPFLNCDGTAFSSAGYPFLATLLGGNTLPDFRGVVPGYLNQGTGRITSGGGGVDGNTVGARGGAQTNTIGSSNLPASIPYSDPGHTHGIAEQFNVGSSAGSPINGVGAGRSLTIQTDSANIGITINAGSANTPITNLPPMTISGLRMIRAG